MSTAKKTGNNTRIYDKRQACYYCKKLYLKIARHYQTVHAKESEVVKALGYPMKSAERKMELERLRLLGNFHHNIQVLETQCGELIVMRRPTESEVISPEDFQPCTHCYGFLRHNELWRHNKTCPFKKIKNGEEDEGEEHKYKNLQQQSKLLLLSQKPRQSNLLNETVASMKSDEITLAARNDDLIIKYGTHLAEKVGGERLHEVSQGMRQLARLLLFLREKSSSGSSAMGLEDFMKPEHFDLIIASVKSLCSFDQSGKTSTVGIPSLALKLGHSLRKCTAILMGKALRQKDNILLTDQQNLEKLIASEWNERISHPSLSMLQSKKFNKIELLPVTSDLEILRKYLLDQLSGLTKSLEEVTDISIWKELAETTLTRLIIFNKRRGGEAAKLKVSSFINRPDWKATSIELISNTLQPIEKELCKRYINYNFL